MSRFAGTQPVSMTVDLVEPAQPDPALARVEVTSLLQSIQVGGDDTTVSVSFTLPSAAVEALKSGMKAHVASH